MLISIVLSLHPGGGKTQRSGGAAEGSPALGTPQNRGTSVYHLQVTDGCRVSYLSVPAVLSELPETLVGQDGESTPL